MPAWKCSIARRILLSVFVLLFVSSCVGGAYAANYTLRSGPETVTLKNIRSSGGKIYISLEFKNNGSEGQDFNWNYGIDVWQNGRKCERYYSGNKNISEEIKDGASIEVTEAFTLRDSASIVEVDVSESFVWTTNEFKVYFNPKTQQWGTKQEASAESTPSPKPTVTPVITARPTPSPSDQNVETVWVCPSCGRELTSKFCPDCGTTSPTPEPTATPTPSPTPVPMDLSKPVENVVKYLYTVYEDDKETAGIYTGEIVDGFPHGYGVFECDAWIYVGEWTCGVKSGQGHLFILPPRTISQADEFTVGNYVTFGTYPQVATGDDMTPIEWIVLARDGQRALLLSRYGLDAKPYNTERTDVTWRTCTLRGWLNEEFINRAFTVGEQAGILETEVGRSSSQVYNGWISGNNTRDRIFLLSSEEVDQYFGTVNDNPKTRVSPTEYALQQGALTNSDFKTVDGEVAGWWWLRSPWKQKTYNTSISMDGNINRYGVHNTSGCIRPALWINLESGIF